jgi:hypothetical protein
MLTLVRGVAFDGGRILYPGIEFFLKILRKKQSMHIISLQCIMVYTKMLTDLLDKHWISVLHFCIHRYIYLHSCKDILCTNLFPPNFETEPNTWIQKFTSYKAPSTKGHPSYQARCQMHRDSKILLNWPPPIDTIFFIWLTDFSLWKLFSKSCWTRSEQVKNDHFERVM